MADEIDEFEDELKRLSARRGLDSHDILERTGPLLRLICGIDPETGPAQARELLKAGLLELGRPLPADLREAAHAGFGIGEEFRLPTYTARIDKIASPAGLDLRTITRRFEKGRRMMAQNAVLPPRPPVPRPTHAPGPWHTADLHVSVTLDLPVPEVVETRRIVADEDGLETVELAVSLAPPAGWNGGGTLHDLGLDLLYGGEIVERVMKSPNRIGFVLRLPHPLGRNKDHEYAFRVRFTPDRPMAPYYVCTPNYRCERFRLRVRFSNRLPDSVWRLRETLPIEVTESWETREAVSPDPCGEVYGEFFDLKPRLSYGFAWDFTPAAASGDRIPS